MNTKKTSLSPFETQALLAALLVISAIPMFTDWKLWPRLAFPLMAMTAAGLYVDWRVGRAFGGSIKKTKAIYAVITVATIAVFWWGK